MKKKTVTYKTKVGAVPKWVVDSVLKQQAESDPSYGLAKHIRDRWCQLDKPGDCEHGRDGFRESLPESLRIIYEMEWERDFWKRKALNQ